MHYQPLFFIKMSKDIFLSNFFSFMKHYDLMKLRMLRFGMIQFVCFLSGMQVQVISWVIFFSISLRGLFNCMLAKL